MPNYVETFLCTPLPEATVGTRLRLAVLISPRLTSDAPGKPPLDNWPDARDWPKIRPTWKVTLQQGTAAPVPLVGKEIDKDGNPVGPDSYDGQTWTAVFPGAMPTTPYQPPLPKDGATNPELLPKFATVRVGPIRDAVKALHLQILRDFRTVLPTLDVLKKLPQFAPILDAVLPATLAAVRDLQLNGLPVDLGVPANLFAQLDLFNGARPGSALPPPTVTAVAPNSADPTVPVTVTITGDKFIAGTTVVFGRFGAATGVLVTNEKTIICMSPTGKFPDGVFLEQVDVVVATPGGPSTPTAASKFTYVGAPTVTTLTPARGPVAGGTTVRIDGTNFVAGNNAATGKPNTLVTFGGVDATKVDVGSLGTSLFCTTPAAGDQLVVDVVVTTVGGTATSTFSYVAAPTVTVVSPTRGPVAGGQPVTVTGTNLAGATAVTFGTVPATKVVVPPGAAPGSLTCVSPAAAAAGPVQVHVVTDGGPSAETPPQSTFTYLAPPTVTALSPKQGPAAGGTDVTVTGTNLDSATAVRFSTTTNPGTPITVRQVTATSLICTSPPGTAGTAVNVVVSTTLAGDSSPADAGLFTYTE